LAEREAQVNSRPLRRKKLLEDDHSPHASRKSGQEGEGRGGEGRLAVPHQPEETLGSFVFPLLELVSAEVLDVFRLERSSKLSFSDFLWRA
jgi:hypothetical protein